MTTRAARHATTVSTWASLLWARGQSLRRLDFGGFDRQIAEDLLAGRESPAAFADSPGCFRWPLGGEVALLPQPHVILTGRLARLALGGVAQRQLTSDSARRLAQRVRASR